MNLTSTPFDLRAWRLRLRLTQAQAAAALGMALSSYRAAEYVAQDQAGVPCRKTVALLAQALEREQKRSAA